MNKYGLRIKNIEAATLYAVNQGTRDRYEQTDAMLTNSLFLDFLLENGLKHNGESTLDIIGLDFSFGTRSYEEETQHLQKRIKYYEELTTSAINEEDIIKYNNKLQRLHNLLDFANDNQDKFVKLSKEQIREIFYRDGCDITYITRNKKGEIKNTEKIHYKMLFRSVGKAKKGNCIFIRDRLYYKTKKFLTMGLKIPKENSPLVEISAYSPLISSTIIGRVQIDPHNILIIKDIDSYFKTNVVSIETDEEKHCYAKQIDNYQLKNTLFDGQALIDSSIFPQWADGFILLRQHFTKMAAFNTNIQQFFKDYYGEQYETAIVYDMFNNPHYAKDIQLITTDNAIKWLKFNVSYEYWCDKVAQNHNNFGIVKTTHASKLGDVQRMSYQMVNALNIKTMHDVIQPTMDYIIQLKTNDDVFLDYLDKNKNFSNDYEALIALVNQDREFTRSEYYRDRKRKIVEAYLLNVKNGRIIQNADNLTAVGSPYAMLLAAVGEDVEKDYTLQPEDGVIQCYSERFDNDEYLAAFRSPFNSRNNMSYLHNIRNETIQKYFSFGRYVIAVNCLHTDIQDRNNGMDFDSDTLYVTNQPQIVEHAKYCYENYPTIVNNIPKEKAVYNDTPLDYATMDNGLAAAQLAIGESSNLAQIALTYSYNFDDVKYQNYVCILSVLAQAAIDNAKRRSDIDLIAEIKRIKKDMDIKTNGYPAFWQVIRRGFDKNKIDYSLDCPMNYLYNLKVPQFKPKESTLPMSYYFIKHEIDANRRRSKKVEDIIYKYSLQLIPNTKYGQICDRDSEDILLLQNNFDDMINDIRQIYISNNYLGLMSWLINRAFCIGSGVKRNHNDMVTLEKNKSLLLATLYKINPNLLLKCFKNDENLHS